MQINGKVFVVTGGGQGIGRQVALGLLRKGAEVAAVDLNAAKLEETRELAGREAHRLSLHAVNVTDRGAVAALPEAVIQAHGQVDGLLNVAGIIQRFVKVVDLSFEDIDRVLDVNFWGVVAMTKAFLPELLKRPKAAVVNVSSMGGFIPIPGQTLYGASKAAVKMFTEGLHAELRETNVAVTVVFPGAVRTGITANSGVTTPGGGSGGTEGQGRMKLTSPEEAARLIIRGMERGSYRVALGRDAQMLDLFTRLAPERAMALISDRMGSLLDR
ncbi:SDR family oxidoreductase [Tessaracoccus sp. MC1679]|uniref:SDR family NAD(P)-dependent oxidoreductase n=1 Tax=Tessaracoccus sp. MC1679 TaxID=2760313 RepID=UPI0016026F3C|nr:SDR family oxidoreductase [Tessaracoccus sp. MC1679]MBB1516541.1 SDR family oxidoreductase [Tessaracoccus sp. MC1679]